MKTRFTHVLWCVVLGLAGVVGCDGASDGDPAEGPQGPIGSTSTSGACNVGRPIACCY